METKDISKKRIEVFIFSSAFTLVMVGIFVAVGFMLDNWLDTRPLFLIITLVLAYPTIQFYLYKKYKKTTAKK